MPAQRHRSRSIRKVKKKLPGGRLTVHYRRRKPAKAKCSACGKQLAGVPRQRPYKLKKIAKTKRRPSRPYGGLLCSPCTRKIITERVRSEVK